MSHNLRLYKGLLSAALVLIPYFIAKIKFTFFYSGCMDGFGIYLMSTVVIVFLGGPLSLLSSFLWIIDRGKFAITLNKSESRIYFLSNILAVIGVLLTSWLVFAYYHDLHLYKVVR